jgi:hypothetical protein
MPDDPGVTGLYLPYFLLETREPNFSVMREPMRDVGSSLIEDLGGWSELVRKVPLEDDTP